MYKEQSNSDRTAGSTKHKCVAGKTGYARSFPMHLCKNWFLHCTVLFPQRLQLLRPRDKSRSVYTQAVRHKPCRRYRCMHKEMQQVKHHSETTVHTDPCRKTHQWSRSSDTHSNTCCLQSHPPFSLCGRVSCNI